MTDETTPRLPEWMRRLGTPALVVDPHDRVVYMNAHAEDQLGCDRSECATRHCRDVVCGVGPSGRPLCERSCVVRRLAAEAREIPVIRMRSAPSGRRERRFHMTSIPFEVEGAGLHILHLFQDVEREQRLVEHAERIAHRSPDVKVSAEAPPRCVLSKREREVLEHLARDEDPKRVAATLSRSPETIRNHVRHVLRKLGAHSIDEAVALHLLFDPVP